MLRGRGDTNAPDSSKKFPANEPRQLPSLYPNEAIPTSWLRDWIAA